MNLFVIGTGRCGTTTMHALLNKQPGVNLCVEVTQIPVYTKTPNVDIMEHNHLRSEGISIVGEVSPYIAPYMEKFIQRHPDTKVIHLYRDLDELQKSFEAWGEAKHNYWITKVEGGWFEEDALDDLFPYFHVEESHYLDAVSCKKSCISRWQHYCHRVAWRIEMHHPNTMYRMRTEFLPVGQAQQDLLDWIGIPRDHQVIDTELHLNKSADKEEFLKGKIESS